MSDKAVLDYRNPKVSKGQVERLARSYHRKFHATIGTSHMVEDLEQEFWLVWHSACEKFDPSKGFEFEAFLGVSIKNKALGISRRQYRRNSLSAESLDRCVGGDEDLSLIDLVTDDSEPVETQVIRRQERDRIIEKIDPRLRTIVEMLENTPPEIEREVEALCAKAAYAASRGFAMRSPKGVTVSMISEILGISRCVRYKMIDDMQRVIASE